MNREEKREKFRQDALVAWTEYQTTGLHITAEDADQWLAKLQAGKNPPIPKCDK
jgi:predicted transcriptional regulator